MANMICNCCEAEVALSMGLVQLALPSKFVKSEMRTEVSVLKNMRCVFFLSLRDDLRLPPTYLLH